MEMRVDFHSTLHLQEKKHTFSNTFLATLYSANVFQRRVYEY